MEFNKYSRPRKLTDSIVEKQVPKGGEFVISSDQDSLTQGPGGFDLVIRVSRGKRHTTVVPRTDAIPQTEGPEEVVWKRK